MSSPVLYAHMPSRVTGVLQVRSLTHGEASLSMEFSHYAPLDTHTEAQRLLELRGW